MVEHLLAKEKAAGSNPVFRSILLPLLSPPPLDSRVRGNDVCLCGNPFLS